MLLFLIGIWSQYMSEKRLFQAMEKSNLSSVKDKADFPN